MTPLPERMKAGTQLCDWGGQSCWRRANKTGGLRLYRDALTVLPTFFRALDGEALCLGTPRPLHRRNPDPCPGPRGPPSAPAALSSVPAPAPAAAPAPAKAAAPRLCFGAFPRENTRYGAGHCGVMYRLARVSISCPRRPA